VLHGYARVSTIEQNPDAQVETEAGIPVRDVEATVEFVISGTGYGIFRTFVCTPCGDSVSPATPSPRTSPVTQPILHRSPGVPLPHCSAMVLPPGRCG
jgi:hypothetical protein